MKTEFDHFNLLNKNVGITSDHLAISNIEEKCCSSWLLARLASAFLHWGPGMGALSNARMLNRAVSRCLFPC